MSKIVFKADTFTTTGVAAVAVGVDSLIYMNIVRDTKKGECEC